MMYLPRQLVGVAYPFRVLSEGGIFMSTYEEFMVILTVAVLIVAILDYVNHKK